MFKFIDELDIGDTFQMSGSNFIVTSDFKKNGQRLCINLLSGTGFWMDASNMVEFCPIYILDKNNNFMPVKETKKLDANT